MEGIQLAKYWYYSRYSEALPGELSSLKLAWQHSLTWKVVVEMVLCG